MLMTWRNLGRKSGLSETEFTIFKHAMKIHMRDPKNKIGLECSERGRDESFEAWLDCFIDSGIAARWWGPGTFRKWEFPVERDEVRGFLKDAVQCASVYIVFEIHEKKLRRLSRRARTSARSSLAMDTEQEGALEDSTALGGAASENESACISKSLETEEFVVETSQVGSSDIKLISGTELLYLSDLLKRIRKLHGLAPEQRIKDIKITTQYWEFYIDLEGSWDWKHIWGSAIKNNSKTQIFFSLAAFELSYWPPAA